ncbi:Ovate protein family C-terminal protein [Dioscorea alata]|uniref:Ovate protein family C-terminal protein n=1 Tax=Dioscorea alata TaxID=55571 RepID=A0ACB7VZW9_DIOAL|nr:Ovate protein family C-terminal protein [Dioscorea alata]
MPTTKPKFPLRRPVVVDVGCGCRRSKIPSLFSPSTSSLSPSSSSSSHFESIPTLSNTTSPNSPNTEKVKRKKEKEKRRGRRRVSGESVAVVKESEDPYLDFRDSMVVMIVEKEIYAWEELEELLHCFIALNAPHHHALIRRAFADVCREVFSPR